MAIAKRVILFIVTNILVLLTISVVMFVITNVFGVELTGNSYMVVWYALFGMGGAFISLAISRWSAKRMMGVRVIEPGTGSAAEEDLVRRVHEMAKKARLPKMPEVGIYESPEVNAFATGPSKSRSLVAVSTGLLQRMDRDAVDGVLGHEVAHIANGDMVTMTLIQGVINTMVLILARIISVFVSNAVDERARPAVQFGLYFALQILLSILGSIVVAYFSRSREFRADKGGARLAGKEKMLSALRALSRTDELVDPDHKALATLKISGGNIRQLFSTHPPIEVRIRSLEKAMLR